MAQDKIMDRAALIVIGGSAGSLQVILQLLDASMKSTVPILVVMHREAHGGSKLAELLATKTSRKTKEIEDKDPIEEDYLYICPADYHVLVEKDHSFSLDFSEKENFSRPSIDVAIRAAADVYTNRLLCILLSGANADGAEGLKHAKQRGATTVIQEPSDAIVSYMPEQAILLQQADHVYNTVEMMKMLEAL